MNKNTGSQSHFQELKHLKWHNMQHVDNKQNAIMRCQWL